MRFTIRDLLWLMVVVGLGVGWWVDRRQLHFRLSEFDAQAARHKELYSRERERRQMQQEAHAANMRQMNVRLANEADRRILAEQAASAGAAP